MQIINQNHNLNQSIDYHSEKSVFNIVFKRLILLSLVFCLYLTVIPVSAKEQVIRENGIRSKIEVLNGSTSEEYRKKYICIGDTYKIKVRTKKKVTWTSSKKSVISVNKNGVIKAKKKGRATITAKYGNKTKKFVYSVRGHVYKNATCTAPKTCKYCNHTEGKKLNHNWKNKPSSAVKVCSRCKKKVAVSKKDKNADIDVYTKLKKLKRKFPEGKKWTNDNCYKFKWGDKSYRYYGCAAFASICSDYLYPGYDMREHTNINKLKEGDMVRIYNDTHTVVIWKISGNTVTLCEGNYNGRIHWGRTMTKTQLEKDMDYIMTRCR